MFYELKMQNKPIKNVGVGLDRPAEISQNAKGEKFLWRTIKNNQTN